ncbi:sulfatase family protein [Rhodopirellula halodulae]|uniref:sulfatase family protein n=1 Tax=Rhodopirellula halodulae TaxID=2894198 RepID=UPI001E613BCC|nr:arylsulfatase [Rhodopirellula sp. JC737]MCC9655045.1 arylsulfatase [Rhodopirellula sp. JC737]
MLRICLSLVLLLVVSSAFAAEHPNIVLILVDDMGYGDPQCFNDQSKIATPNIDSLAREGMCFRNAHAPGPLCHMSRYGLMTGRYPFRTNVSVWPTQPLIDADQPTLASLAKAQGYRTAMVGKWHLGFEERSPETYEGELRGGPVDRGFDEFFGIRASTDIPPYFYILNRHAVSPPTRKIEANSSEGWSPIQGAFWRAGGIAPELELSDVLPHFTDVAISTIEEHPTGEKASPLMLYLAYPAPHTPWLPSPAFRGKSRVGSYGDFVMMVDHEIGRVLSTLRNQGMDRDTVVIFTSDNGPVWYDKDTDRFEHDSAGALRGMKADAWEAGHRMPFIVRWPGTVPAGSDSDQLVCFTDLMATFAEAWQVELPANAGPDSFSFYNTLTGRPQSQKNPRREFVMRAGSNSKLMTIQKDGWKLITGLGSGGFSKPRRVQAQSGEPDGQLYQVEVDLFEATNLYQQRPDLVKQLSEHLQKIVRDGRSR